MNRIVPILLIFAAGVLACSAMGCGNWQRPRWLGGKLGPQVIAPSETNEEVLPPPAAPAEGAAPTTQPVANDPTATTAPAEPQPAEPAPPIASPPPSPAELPEDDDGGIRPLTALAGSRNGDSSQHTQRTLGQEPTSPEPEETTPRLAPMPTPDPANLQPRGSVVTMAGDEQDETASLRSALAGDEGQTAEAANAPAIRPAGADAESWNLATTQPSDSPATQAATAPTDTLQQGQEVIVAGAVLQVNDTYLTVNDVLAGLHDLLIEVPRSLSSEDYLKAVSDIVRRNLSYEIQEVLIYKEADSLLQEMAKEHIDGEMQDALREMIATAGGSRERLRQKCLAEGTTLEAMLQNQRRRMTNTIYMRQKFLPAVIINRRMLWDYYRTNREKYTTPKKVQMQMVAAPVKEFLPERANATTPPTPVELDTARQAARRQIGEAMTALQNGAEFGAVVKQYSRGLRAHQDGIWPLMAKGNFRETVVEDKAFALPPGEHSGILETERGYFIVRARQVVPGKTVPFEAAQADIEEDLKQEQFLKLRREYMQKLYERATINQSPEFAELVVDRAVKLYR
jgi:hypothetical protein